MPSRYNIKVSQGFKCQLHAKISTAKCLTLILILNSRPSVELTTTYFHMEVQPLSQTSVPACLFYVPFIQTHYPPQTCSLSFLYFTKEHHFLFSCPSQNPEWHLFLTLSNSFSWSNQIQSPVNFLQNASISLCLPGAVLGPQSRCCDSIRVVSLPPHLFSTR